MGKSNLPFFYKYVKISSFDYANELQLLFHFIGRYRHSDESKAYVEHLIQHGHRVEWEKLNRIVRN